MAINIISNEINNIVPNLKRPFTTHELIEYLIDEYVTEWNNLVNSYRRPDRTIQVQQQIAVVQTGRYLLRNARQLNIIRGNTIPNNSIIGLTGNIPRQTTVWL